MSFIVLVCLNVLIIEGYSEAEKIVREMEKSESYGVDI